MNTQEPRRELFGITDNGQEVYRHSIANKSGMHIQLMDLGATLSSVRFRGRELTLGFDNWEAYKNYTGYYGTTCGRFSNRIANAQFKLNGKVYTLSKNHGKHSLHGGINNFARKVWKAETLPAEASLQGIRYQLISPNGDEGYPGELHAELRYLLSEDNCLIMLYRAELHNENAANPDLACPVNLTNHAYWNLAGEDTGHLRDHRMRILADSYVEIDAESIPTGRLCAFPPIHESGEQTSTRDPMDLRTLQSLGSETRNAHPYDHCYALAINSPKAEDELNLQSLQSHSSSSTPTTQSDTRNARDISPTTPNSPAPTRQSLASCIHRLQPRLAAEAQVPDLRMQVYTSYPGVQFYSSKYLNEPAGRSGKPYHPYSAFCLETQYFPDSPNQSGNPKFPNCTLKPGQVYEHITIHRFS